MAPDNSHILAQISITAVQFFFYGLHTVLFSLCAYILSNRAKESPRYKLQLAAVILLFVLSTANVALCLSADVLTWCISCHSETRITQISFAGIYLNLVSNAIADLILLWRCYILWGEKWKTIIPSIVIAVVSHTSALVLTAWVLPHTLRNAAGIETYSFKDVAAGIAGLVIGLNNLLLSFLIAFRILSLLREIMPFLRPQPRKVYSIVIAASIESGVVYSICTSIASILVIKLTWPRHTPHNYTDFYIQATAAQLSMRILSSIAGIASTSIIVCVTLGINLGNAETAMPPDFSFRNVHELSQIERNTILDIARENVEQQDIGVDSTS